MEQYLITPWDTRVGTEPAPVDWDMQVPPEVDRIAEQVMKQYDMTVSSRILITSKPDKGGAIWRIETNKGPRSLKLLHRSPERSLFSVGLQDYVVKKGARVPALIPAKDGKMFVEMGGKLWIVTDWINLTPATKVDLVGAQELCYGLGEFHRHTKGYVPPLGAKNSSRLYRWPNYYQKIAKKIGWMREMAKAYRDTAASASLLAVVDQYEQQAVEALARLKASAYPRMVAMGEPYWGLVHQDYGWSNGQNGPGGLWVIDLDGVSYDLPFRDLRKLITSTMDDIGVWDLTWMRGMIDAYHQANPLDAESYEVLLIDMALPNEFYKHLKEMFFDPLTFLNTEAGAILQRVVATDQSKAQALAELASEKGKYKAGNYEQQLVAAQPQRIPSETSDQKSWALQSQNPTETVAAVVPDEKKSESFKVKKRLAPVVFEPVAAKQESPARTDSKTADKKESDKKTSNKKAKTKEKESTPVVKAAKLVKVDPKQLEAGKAGSESEKTEKDAAAAKRTASTRKAPANNVIDLLPYISNKRVKQTRRANRAGQKKAAGAASAAKKNGTSAAKPKQQAEIKKSKAVSKPAALPKQKAKAAKPLVKQPAKQVAKPAVRGAAAGNHAKKAAQPKSKHSYKKVPAPTKRWNKQAGNRPGLKKGVRAKGVR